MNTTAVGSLTGVWYDPDQAGHGLVLEQSSAGRLFASWYTFDPSGKHAWFFGEGDFNGTMSRIDVVRPQGTYFPPAFRADRVTSEPIGRLTLRFTSCGAGVVEFDLSPPFGKGSMRLVRLTQPVGVPCGSTPQPTGTGPSSWLTGTWFDPSLSGQGLAIESLPGGLVFASWFTYGASPQGGQMWLVGTSAAQGEQVVLRMARPAGGQFVPNFNPAALAQPEVGTVTLRVDSCRAVRMDYQLDGNLGAGHMDLLRLTKPEGVVCD